MIWIRGHGNLQIVIKKTTFGRQMLLTGANKNRPSSPVSTSTASRSSPIPWRAAAGDQPGSEKEVNDAGSLQGLPHPALLAVLIFVIMSLVNKNFFTRTISSPLRIPSPVTASWRWVTFILLVGARYFVRFNIALACIFMMMLQAE